MVSLSKAFCFSKPEISSQEIELPVESITSSMIRETMGASTPLITGNFSLSILGLVMADLVAVLTVLGTDIRRFLGSLMKESKTVAREFTISNVFLAEDCMSFNSSRSLLNRISERQLMIMFFFTLATLLIPCPKQS